MGETPSRVASDPQPDAAKVAGLGSMQADRPMVCLLFRSGRGGHWGFVFTMGADSREQDGRNIAERAQFGRARFAFCQPAHRSGFDSETAPTGQGMDTRPVQDHFGTRRPSGTSLVS